MKIFCKKFRIGSCFGLGFKLRKFDKRAISKGFSRDSNLCIRTTTCWFTSNENFIENSSRTDIFDIFLGFDSRIGKLMQKNH